MTLISEQLQSIQCPINWGFEELKPLVKIDLLVPRWEEVLEENSPGQERKIFFVMLVLAYEYNQAGRKVSDVFDLKHIEKIAENDSLLQKNFTAVQHIIYGMQVLIDSSKHPQNIATRYLSKIKPYNELANSEKAFTFAVKASCLMLYGPAGFDEAKKSISEALRLERDEPEWHFLKGKVLSRRRRLHYRAKVEKWETDLFRKAVSLKPDCSRYLVQLARSLSELCRSLYFNATKVQHFESANHLSIHVVALLRKAMSLGVGSHQELCYVAKSLMNLSTRFQNANAEQIEDCLMQALHISPSDPLVNHTMGLFCLKKGGLEDALYFLNEASNMGVAAATLDLCRLRWQECRSYDPVPDLTKLLEKCDYVIGSEVSCQLACYYFFVKYDLPSTVEHWKQWRHSCYKGCFVINSMFVGQQIFDFTAVLYDEIRLELEHRSCSDPKDQLLQDALQIVNENRPELQNTEPWRQRQLIIDRCQMTGRIAREKPQQDANKKGPSVRRSRNGARRARVATKGGCKRDILIRVGAHMSGESPSCRNYFGEARGRSEKRRGRSQSCNNLKSDSGQRNVLRQRPSRHASVGSLDTMSPIRIGSGRLNPDACPEGLEKSRSLSLESLVWLISKRSYPLEMPRHGTPALSRATSESFVCRTGSSESLTNNRPWMSRTQSVEQLSASRELSQNWRLGKTVKESNVSPEKAAYFQRRGEQNATLEGGARHEKRQWTPRSQSTEEISGRNEPDLNWRRRNDSKETDSVTPKAFFQTRVVNQRGAWKDYASQPLSKARGVSADSITDDSEMFRPDSSLGRENNKQNSTTFRNSRSMSKERFSTVDGTGAIAKRNVYTLNTDKFSGGTGDTSNSVRSWTQWKKKQGAPRDSYIPETSFRGKGHKQDSIPTENQRGAFKQEYFEGDRGTKRPTLTARGEDVSVGGRGDARNSTSPTNQPDSYRRGGRGDAQDSMASMSQPDSYRQGGRGSACDSTSSMNQPGSYRQGGRGSAGDSMSSMNQPGSYRQGGRGSAGDSMSSMNQPGAYRQWERSDTRGSMPSMNQRDGQRGRPPLRGRSARRDDRR